MIQYRAYHDVEEDFSDTVIALPLILTRNSNGRNLPKVGMILSGAGMEGKEDRAGAAEVGGEEVVGATTSEGEMAGEVDGSLAEVIADIRALEAASSLADKVDDRLADAIASGLLDDVLDGSGAITAAESIPAEPRATSRRPAARREELVGGADGIREVGAVGRESVVGTSGTETGRGSSRSETNKISINN